MRDSEEVRDQTEMRNNKIEEQGKDKRTNGGREQEMFVYFGKI